LPQNQACPSLLQDSSPQDIAFLFSQDYACPYHSITHFNATESGVSFLEDPLSHDHTCPCHRITGTLSTESCIILTHHHAAHYHRIIHPIFFHRLMLPLTTGSCIPYYRIIHHFTT
jgi:hypothetical protein